MGYNYISVVYTDTDGLKLLDLNYVFFHSCFYAKKKPLEIGKTWVLGRQILNETRAVYIIRIAETNMFLVHRRRFITRKIALPGS